MDVLKLYNKAKKYVHSSGYWHEVEWQENRNLKEVSEQEFLEEYAWVVFCSGFKEEIVRKHFKYISLCFCDWESAKEIVTNEYVCSRTALSAIGNKRKIKAIINTAKIINKEGFESFKKRIIHNPINTLIDLDFIGKITVLHLAKNLGASVVKPDRHLVNLAEYVGATSVISMCQLISDRTGDQLGVIDIILWRFMVLTSSNSKLHIASL